MSIRLSFYLYHWLSLVSSINIESVVYLVLLECIPVYIISLLLFRFDTTTVLLTSIFYSYCVQLVCCVVLILVVSMVFLVVPFVWLLKLSVSKLYLLQLLSSVPILLGVLGLVQLVVYLSCLGFKYLSSSIPLLTFVGVAIGVGLVFNGLLNSLCRNPFLSSLFVRCSCYCLYLIVLRVFYLMSCSFHCPSVVAYIVRSKNFRGNLVLA